MNECQRILMHKGQPYPRTCAKCGLGPCNESLTATEAARLETENESLRAENAHLRLLLGPMLRFRHKATAGTYTLLHLGVRLEQDGDAGPSQAVYVGDAGGRWWVRPESEFFDGRFERVPYGQS